MKKRIFATVIILLLILSSIVLVKSMYKPKDTNWPKNGLYFAKWNSYQGYFVDEKPYIQLSIINVHSNTRVFKIPSFIKYILISDKGEIETTAYNYNTGSETKDYSVYSLGLNLPGLEPNEYKINKLKLISSGGKVSIYDIGKFIIDVRQGSTPNDFKVGKRSFVSVVFNSYKCELTNSSNTNITIDSLEYKFPYSSYKTTITSGNNFSDFNIQNPDHLIKPNITKTYLFSFVKATDSANSSSFEFVSFKPFIHYKVGESSKISTLPVAIYAPVIDDSKILKIAKSLSYSNLKNKRDGV